MKLNLKIIFIATSSNASPARGGRRRIVDVAHQTAKFNIESRILCFLPFEQVSKGLRFLKTGKASLARESETIVYYVPKLPLTRFDWLFTLSTWYCGLITALFCARFQTRLIYGHGAEAGLISITSRNFIKNIKIISDFHGAPAEEYTYSRQLKSPDKTVKRIKNYEAMVLQESDQIIFVSHAMQYYFEHKLGLRITKSEIIPCAIENEVTLNQNTRDLIRSTMGLTDKLVISYAGSAVDYQLSEKMCQLFRKINDHFHSAYFLILSHDTELFIENLERASVSQENYKILAVNHEQVFDLLQASDIGLMLRDSSPVNIVASPTKFAEYLLCGLPVILTEFVGDYSEMVKRHRLGYIVNLSDLSINTDFSVFIKDVQENRLDYAIQCSKFVREHLSWNVYGEKLSYMINTLSTE